MPRPARAEQFHSQEICVVHAVQRCVRRAFLAGIDALSGTDYSYRRQWIARRMEALASVFGIDVLTYAVMSNHLHLILRNRPDVVAAWSDQDVAIRWLRVFPGRRLDDHLAEPSESDVQMLVSQPERLALIRQRLSDISWFMRALSEPIARMANRQDECTGRFWEGRFKALRIADEAGLLACAMYVDLNPVRAALASSPEQAVHTSAYDRFHGERGQKIDSAAFDLVPVSRESAAKEARGVKAGKRREGRKAKRRNPTGRKIRRDGWLCPLSLAKGDLSSKAHVHRDGLRASDKGFLSMDWKSYFSLLRWTASQRTGEEGSEVPSQLASVLSSFGIDSEKWRDLVWNFKKYFGRSSCVGSPASMAKDAERTGKRWHSGQRMTASLFATS